MIGVGTGTLSLEQQQILASVPVRRTLPSSSSSLFDPRPAFLPRLPLTFGLPLTAMEEGMGTTSVAQTGTESESQGSVLPPSAPSTVLSSPSPLTD